MTGVTVQHVPHVGSGYRSGADGKRVAIVGYSHHSNDEDHEAFTVNCIENIDSGKWKKAFFDQIASYFGSTSNEFWATVAFLNFLPRIVGDGDHRFANGTAEDTEEGKVRMLAFFEQHKPDLLFVFSTKAWKGLPKTLEDGLGKEGGDLIPGGSGYDRQHYRTSGGHIIQAFGLRHPQGAKKEAMKKAVASALVMKPNPPS